MADSKTYRVEIPADTDFLEGWKDASIPHMDFVFDQLTLEECEEVDGVYFATYKSWVVNSARSIEYVTATGTEIVEIPAGEYGIKP